MSFFDKFFSIRNRNNCNNHGFKPETEGLRSSHLSIQKDQIRFVLFRECDKRGRKLLFDSNSVEKIPLPSKGSMCNPKCQHQNDKCTDFIETYETHGYKYKKLPNDVYSLGEMVFGSVAVVYKAINSCKIHCIPSPKRLMFTTIVHAPFRRSPGSTVSELNVDHSSGSSLASLTDVLNQQVTSSSDSKLYRHEGVAQKYSSTYPWIKPSFPVNKVKHCCEISDYNITGMTCLPGSGALKFSESLCPDNRTNGHERICVEGDFMSGNNLSLNQKNLDFEKNSLSNYGSSGITSNESENISSISGSLSSLRRRWAHSFSTSLDSTTYEDTRRSPLKKRTKLGMALILDLSNTQENEIEKLIFNHTIVIDSLMYKLQDSVELAYIRNENFVDLIYTAFLECQESIYELVTGGKYKTPLWCSVFADPNNGLETLLNRMSLCKMSMGTCSKQDLVNNVQLKFLNDFCDVLVKFDTKDTNFFISTLLTAVLTHHLSWVNSIAESDLNSLDEKLSVINSSRPYNPIWAQLNDLCGLLGSPLKSAKTVVTGPESKKSHLAAIIEVLSYFIRCNNVVENIYEVDVDDIINTAALESNDADLDSDAESAKGNFKKQCLNSNLFEVKAEEFKSEHERDLQLKEKLLVLEQSVLIKTAPGTSLKRSKSYLSHLEKETPVRNSELYPDIKDLAESENINIADLNDDENERTIFVENFLSRDKLKEKIQKMIRVPSVSVKPHAEGYLSPDEGYNTIDSTKTDNFKENKVQMERQRSAPENRKENIVFLLGENEELVNIHKKVVVNTSSFVDMEKENFSLEKYASVNNKNEGDKNRTLERSCDNVDRTFWVNDDAENLAERFCSNEDSRNRVTVKTPWIIREIKLPRVVKPCRTRRLEVSSVLGGVNQHYHSEQVIQGVLGTMNGLEGALKKDLFLSARNPVLEKNVAEALCIVGDMNSWEVTILLSNKSVLDCNKRSGIRVGMSQLVADMLESFLYLHTSNLSPSFCLDHIEKKLREIYLKSKTVAELLDSTKLCSMEHLTASLDIGINDVPLLLSVASTHSPHLAEKYVLSYS